MEKEILNGYVEQGMSANQIAKISGKGATTIRYWLSKHELSTTHKSFKEGGSVVEYGETKHCPKCCENKLIEKFYNRRGKEGGSVYCISCSNDESRERARRFKIKCVEYKGGSCEKCGYDKYIGALQFHHLDPNKKDFGLANVKSHKFDEKIKKELDKCILVCANCHFEIHGSLV